MTFGEKMQELRRKAGMSQDTLAEQLDVSRQAVSKWERDETMPETEKVVRIAQLFHVSLDELLLDREPPKEPEPQPQPQYRPVYRHNYINQFRRHGYKLGYVLMAVGALICAFSLIMRLVWPAFGTGFFGSDLLDVSIADVPLGTGELVIEGNWEMSDYERQALLDAIAAQSLGEMGYDTDFLWGGHRTQMANMLGSALQAQANLFLIGLLPGGVLLAVGIFIVVKGKKYTRQMPDGM